MFYPYFHIFICQCMAKKYIYEHLPWSSHNFKPLRMCSIPSKAKNSKFFPRVFGSDREIGGSIECTDKITTPTHLSLAL